MSCWKTLTALKTPCTVFGKRSLSTSSTLREKHSCRLLVIGGGTGGCSTAAKFACKVGMHRCIIIDPSDRHYYQPMFTMIGGGLKNLSQSYKSMGEVLPEEALWIKDKVAEIDPKKCQVTTCKGDIVEYDYMVVATGIELDFEKIPGLLDGLKDPKSGVCSNYSPEFCEKTFQVMKRTEKGNALFTHPSGPVKCAGAPQKIAYLTAHFMEMKGRKNVKVTYNTALPVIFRSPKYAEALWKVAKKRHVKVVLNSELLSIDLKNKCATFKRLDVNCTYSQEFEMLHVCPPQRPSSVISKNKELADSSGFLDVSKESLQHSRYDNIFGIGDCTSLPTSKTGAAVAGQLGVLRKNLQAIMDGKNSCVAYDGYTSCPLVTGYGSCIMAEFDYNLDPLETFPFDQGVERLTMYHMKKDLMPQLYFNLMLKGLWEGPGIYRKLLHLGNSK